MRTQSNLEVEFENLWRALGNGKVPVKEHEFHSERGWRFDFAFLDEKVAVELDGGLRSNEFFSVKQKRWVRTRGGRHNRAEGFIKDCDKLNAAVEEGWRVLRYTADHLKKCPVQIVEQVKKVLEENNPDQLDLEGGDP